LSNITGRSAITVAMFPAMSCRSRHSELTTTVDQLRAELRQLRRELEHIRVDNAILREAAASLIHLAPAHERFAFIHAHSDRFSKRRLSRVLITDRSNYRAWVHAPGLFQSPRQRMRPLVMAV